jgi:hypothetical protein
MQFYSHPTTFLRQGKEGGVCGDLRLLFASIGLLLATFSRIALSSLGLSSRNLLLVSVPLYSIFTLSGVICLELLIWPCLQSYLAGNGDKFKYELLLRERLIHRIKLIKRSNVGANRIEQWLENAYQEYFDHLKVNEEQIAKSRIESSKPINIEEGKLYKSKSIKINKRSA